MLQIKIISYPSKSGVEEMLAKWVKDDKPIIQSVQFSTVVYEDELWYSVMISYIA